MNALTPAPATNPPRTRSPAVPSIQITTFQDLIRFAEYAAPTELMPKDYRGKPGNIVIAVQLGSELGLSPMQSLSSISVINGRASVWGDALLGLIRHNPLCQDVHETIAGEGDARTATCRVKRAGSSDIVRTFSVADAKKAQLWSKPGTWQQYPDRMLAMRARGFALRDSFPDVLRGLISAEEAQDMPRDTFQGTTIQATAEPTPAATAPPPSPVDTIRARLASCEDKECVARVADAWRRTVDKKAATGEPFSEVLLEDVTEMLAAAYGRFVNGADDAGEPVDDDLEMPE